jgi:hypothetical protein
MVKDGGVPSNVRHLVHGYRSRLANSRPMWGNCGTRSWWGVRRTLQLKITHWGASGTVLTQGIPAGIKPGDLVTEEDYIRGVMRPTSVTWAEDVAAAGALWAFVQAHIAEAYLDCIRFQEPRGGTARGN